MSRETDKTTLTEGELVWRDLDDGEDEDRSSVTKAVVPLGVVAALLAMSLLGSPAASAHTTFTANDTSTTTNAGQVTSLTITPTGDVHYDGLETAPSSVDLAVQVRLGGSGSWETVATKSLSASGKEGSTSYDWSGNAIDVLDNSGLEPPDFRADPDGSSTDTTVGVRVQATLVGVGDGGSDVVVSSSDTFTVSVTNQPAGGQVGGAVDTNAG